jgi:hypothetical protein
MTRFLALGLATLILAACTPTKPPPVNPEPARRPPVTYPMPSNDQCGAAEHQRYVGRLRTEIPVPVNPSQQRVACMTCPMTMDFNPRRLNFLFDAGTGIVREVKCG